MFWSKKFKKELSFGHSLIILIIFFFTSTLIIYYTSLIGLAEPANLKIKSAGNSYKNQANFLTIIRPKANDKINNSFIISGAANLNTDKIYYRLLNGQKEVLFQGNIILEKTNQDNNFNLEINYPNLNYSGRGVLEFYVSNSYLNQETVLVAIPVNFI